MTMTYSQIYWNRMIRISAHWLNNENSCGSSQRDACQRGLIELVSGRDLTPLQTSLTVKPQKHKTQLSSTYILLLCLCDVTATLFFQLHVSREWGWSLVGGWEGVAAWDSFVTDRKCSLLSHDIVLTRDRCLLNVYNLFKVDGALLWQSTFFCLFLCSSHDTCLT